MPMRLKNEYGREKAVGKDQQLFKLCEPGMSRGEILVGRLDIV